MNYSEKWNPHNTFRSLWRTSCINSNPHRVPTSTKTYRKYKLHTCTSIRYLAGNSKHCFKNISITLVSYDIYIYMYVCESKKVCLQIHTCSNKQVHVPLHCTTNSPPLQRKGDLQNSPLFCPKVHWSAEVDFFGEGNPLMCKHISLLRIGPKNIKTNN